MNILLIEDDAGLVELITEKLEELGFSVMSAVTGAEGLASLSQQTPDMILLDYSLPDINGRELIETVIRQQIPLPPFIITTGQGDERIAVNMMKLGAMDYLVKDILFLERLPDVVQRVVKEIESASKLKQAEEALKQSEATIRNKLKAITEPEGDISTLELSDIIDTEILQSIMEDFYQITGMLGAVIDISGKVLVAVGWQDICTKFHRCNPDTLKNCIESDTFLTQGVPEGTCKAYHCKNNMWDIVTPIMVGGKHVGNVFMGQYFLEGEVPNVEFFRKQAKKYGFDENEYLEALDRVPHFSKEAVDSGMKFYSKFAGLISSLSYSTIQQSRMLAQQKLAEEELTKAKNKAEQNQKLYEDLVQSSHNLIWKCDLEGKFTFLNSAWENTHGYKVEEMLGRPFSDFQRPEIFERDVIEFTKHLEGGFVKDYETTHIIKDGTEIPLIFNALPLLNSSGEIIGTQGTAFDISKLKQTELDLIEAKNVAEESEDRLRGFMASATDGFMLFDSVLNQIDVNDVALRITKQKREEIIGRNMLEVVPDLKKSGRYDKFMEVISTGNPITFDDILPHAKFGDIRVSLKAFKVAQGLGIILTDITERKKAEDKIRSAEEKYKALYENAPLSYQSLNEDGTFKDVNPFWLETLGYERHEIIGEKYADFLHPDWAAHFETNFPAFKKRGYVSDVQFKIRHKKGHYLDISFEGCIGYNPDGSVRQTYCVFQDITERKQAEEKLKISEERLKTILNSSPFPIAVVDVNDDIIKYWSISAKQLFGHDPKNSAEWYELVYPDPNYRNDVIQRWKPFLEIAEKSSKAVNTGEYRLECKDGSIKICEIYAQSIPNNLIVTFNDITERKKAEEKIHTAEKNLKNTFDLSPSIIAKANMELGHFIQVNKAVTKILGYTIDEFTSKPYMDFVHPDDWQTTIDIATEQLKGNEVTFFENRYLCKDGSYKWMAWHGTKPDKDGVVTTIGSDINERKLIEQEIAETKQFYENIIEGVQDGIWVTDKNDVIFYANSTMEKIAGIPREQIQGNNILKDFPEETIGEFSKFYKQAKKEKKPVWYEIEAITHAKKDVYQNGWLIPQYQNNDFSGIICTVRDISERKKAEGSVRKLSTAVQQSPSSIVIADTEGKLEYVNPKYTEVTGYSSSESIGLKSNIFKSDEQDALFYKEIWKIVDSGKVWRGQFHTKRKNGELFWEAASISAILNESGDIINYIKIGEDITQQKNTEAELNIALEKALESDRLKSAFLANMSHEIRTPMNGILGFVNLLNEPNLNKTKIGKYSAIINKSGERLLNTINDIIDISKIEAGEMIISNTETSINNVMEELHSFFSPEANLKEVSLLIEPSFLSEPLSIITDSHKLYGILTNLIKNAIKYTEKGHITFGYSVKDKFIEFFVEDTGIGIPNNRLQAIFNRFEQADIEDSEVFEGSGLGLAISKAYTEMLGGEISVKSEEGKGSKFEFTIPYVKTIKKETEQIPEDFNNEATRTENLNLLIVEDDYISSELLKSTMQGLFKEIILVDNGKDAIETCKNNPKIDLVLMDIKMPKMNGYDATSEIRKFNKDLPIIAQTAYALRGDKEKAIEVGCNDYITKPINKVQLLKVINKLIG